MRHDDAVAALERELGAVEVSEQFADDEPLHPEEAARLRAIQDAPGRDPALSRALGHAQAPPASLVGGTSGSRHLVALRQALVMGDEIKRLPKLDPLVEGVLDRNTFAELYGRTGSGKSFVAISVAACVATGTPWFGRAVHPGPVLYVAAEGASGLGDRLDSWQQHERVYTSGDLIWLPRLVNLIDEQESRALADLVGELRCVLVIIDTLARSMPGADENSSRDMGSVVRHLEAIQRASAATVAVIHHSGKDPAAGSRGHSALKAALDTEIRCDGAEGRLTLHAEKQRHRADGDVIARLRLVEVGESCALREAGAANEEPTELTATDRTALDALASIEVPGGVTATIWRQSTDLSERTFFRARKRLLERDHVVNVSTDKAPRYITATATELPTS